MLIELKNITSNCNNLQVGSMIIISYLMRNDWNKKKSTDVIIQQNSFYYYNKYHDASVNNFNSFTYLICMNFK